MGGRNISQWYKYTADSDIEATANYAKDNLPVRYLLSSTRYLDYSYDSLNRLTGKTLSLATPLSYAYTYKASDREGNYTTSLISREDIGNKFYKYAYDDLGNITNIVSGVTGESQSSYRRYRYDPLNQLIREDNEASRETYIYVYDDYGNITEKRVYERFFEEEASADELKEVITYKYETASNAGWKKLLTEYNGEAITYDAIGNPTKYRGADLDWDTRELKSYKISDDLTVRYKYDADGLRSSKTFDDGVEETVDPVTKYQYVSGKLMYEDRNGTDIYYYYDSYGTPTAIRYYETVENSDGSSEIVSYMFYLATNQQGDIIGIYNASGNMVVKYEYDAWGNIISTTDANGGALNSLSQKWSDINPFRYRGYYWDAETGLYYLQSRYYDAETGRFLNADDASVITATPNALTDKNLFSYCDNNPVMREDNGGAFWDIVLDVVSIVASAVEVVKNPDDVGAWVGLALDVVDVVIPTGGGLGEAYDAYRVYDKGKDALRHGGDIIKHADDIPVRARGWNVGDDISNLTKAGNEPSWTTVRQRYWKNEAYYRRNLYDDDALKLMEKGRAPIGPDGYPIELHHYNGRDGFHFFEFEPLTRTDHRYIHYGK